MANQSSTSFSRRVTRLSYQGYLVLLYVLLIVIRFVLVFGLYPITSRIGLGTNVRESVFMSYGGFRGTVGIALALSLNTTGEWLLFRFIPPPMVC
jgi:NhaP-type Na+/H+ or K+/H+ antiporter